MTDFSNHKKHFFLAGESIKNIRKVLAENMDEEQNSFVDLIDEHPSSSSSSKHGHNAYVYNKADQLLGQAQQTLVAAEQLIEREVVTQ